MYPPGAAGAPVQYLGWLRMPMSGRGGAGGAAGGEGGEEEEEEEEGNHFFSSVSFDATTSPSSRACGCRCDEANTPGSVRAPQATGSSRPMSDSDRREEKRVIPTVPK